MTKMFAEVFPPLHVEQGLQDLLEQVRVEKVTSNRAKNFIRVYLVSGKLIHKEQLFQLERTLKKQLFGGADITVKILERFELSGQYNPEKLMELYKDSILFELRNYSMLEYNLFRGAKISFPESNLLKMELKKTTLGEDAADELIRILYKIFTDRCGLDVKIQVEFVDKQEEKKKRSGRADVEKQAEALNAAMWAAKQAADASEGAESVENADGKSAAAGAGTGNSSSVKTEKKPAAVASGGKKNFGNFGKSEYAYGKTLRSGGGFRSRGASNNPDVLYGRDFDDSEIIDLVQVIGEMGEVVIHGQVTGWDEREIRG